MIAAGIALLVMVLIFSTVEIVAHRRTRRLHRQRPDLAGPTGRERLPL